MKNIIRCALIIGVPLLLTTNAYSANHHLRGEIKNISAITDGLLIMLDTGIPDNCSGTPYGWMLIKQDHTALTSMVLTAWASGKKKGTVYTSGRAANGTGFCVVNQFDVDG